MWRPRLLARDAVQNLGPLLMGVGAAITAILGALGALTAVQAVIATDQQQARELAGANVWWIQVEESDAPVSAGVCEGLRRVDGVVGAGGVGKEQPDGFRVFEDSRPVTVDYGTVGLWAAWAAPALDGEVVVGSQLEALGLTSVGTTLTNPDGEHVRVEARTLDSVRPSRLLASVTIPRLADFELSECWVRMEGGEFEVGRDLVEYAFAGYPVKISPYSQTEDDLLSPLEQWQNYVQLQPWVGAGALSGLLICLGSWTRRSEFAIYRMFGTSRVELALLVGVESGMIVAPAAIIGGAVAFVITATGADPFMWDIVKVGFRFVASAALLGWVVGSMLSPLAIRGNLADQLKDR